MCIQDDETASQHRAWIVFGIAKCSFKSTHITDNKGTLGGALFSGKAPTF